MEKLAPTGLKPDLTIFYTILVSICKLFLDESFSTRSCFLRSLAAAIRHQDDEELQVTSNKQVPAFARQSEAASWVPLSWRRKDAVLAVCSAEPSLSQTHGPYTGPITIAGRPPARIRINQRPRFREFDRCQQCRRSFFARRQTIDTGAEGAGEQRARISAPGSLQPTLATPP